MTQPDERAYSRLLKLLELAKRGEAGERDNAERMLNNLLAKYHMTLEDLEASHAEVAEHPFFVESDLDKRLLVQIAALVTGIRRVNTVTIPAENGWIIVLDCTAGQAVEIEFSFTVYKRALSKEVDLVFQAFVQRNRIFAPTNDTNRLESDKDQTRKQDEMSQLQALIKAFPTTSILKALPKEG